MDLVNNLLQPNAPMKTLLVPGAEVDGAMDIMEKDMGEMYEPEGSHLHENYGYARAYQEKETATYMDAAKRIANEDSNTVINVSVKETFHENCVYLLRDRDV